MFLGHQLNNGFSMQSQGHGKATLEQMSFQVAGQQGIVLDGQNPWRRSGGGQVVHDSAFYENDSTLAILTKAAEDSYRRIYTLLA
ncbi:adenine specific DNA methylase Mod [Pseudomonas sp. StFLB209]|nr:adenine specific DNA methylase Mod [Pseudomonas sp. StFLB209]